ncbi:hypothetical protein P167DRAFT_767 [Morchella conica CCBAS932]|uniref:Uncharacterized protein n=1 Tax=Morchella conica CCBAS932 TaxID=1392247 RepID=A0A3N4L6S7_9PEZI|nr:hypothetical protein P167DRAFT_767 [Morchella conica CCBAS932]
MYFATTSKLSALQNKYTLNITALSFYHHASDAPSLPIAATSDIYTQIHPSPDALAENIGHIMTICVMLREEQGDIIRELKKLGQSTGVDIDLEDGGTSGVELESKQGWMGRTETLNEIVEKVKILEESIEKIGERLRIHGNDQENGSLIREQMFLSKENKQPRKRTQQDDIAMNEAGLQLGFRGQERKPQKAPLPVIHKRKRKGADDDIISGVRKQDSGASPVTHHKSKRGSKKEVPNSQSADEAEDIDNNDGGEEYQEIGGDWREGEGDEEEEETESRIKSLTEKRRKAMSVPIIDKGKPTGRRVLQRKAHK